MRGIDLIFGIPFAFILVREKWGKLQTILDTILDIPLTIPSAALGFAIFMFLSDHCSFEFGIFVKITSQSIGTH